MDKTLLLDATLGWHHQYDATLPSDGSGARQRRGRPPAPASAPLRTPRPPERHAAGGLPHITEFEAPAAIPRVRLPERAIRTSRSRRVTRCPVSDLLHRRPRLPSGPAAGPLPGQGAWAPYLFKRARPPRHQGRLDIERLSFYNDRARTRASVAYRRRAPSGTRFFRPPPVRLPDRRRTAGRPRAVQASTSSSHHDRRLPPGQLDRDRQGHASTSASATTRRRSTALDGKLGLSCPTSGRRASGVIYDFTQQGRSKLFANYARYYESVPLDMADRSLPAASAAQRRATSRRAGVRPGCNPRSPAGRRLRAATRTCQRHRQPATIPNQSLDRGGRRRRPVDPNLKPQSSDEFVVGGEYELFADGRIGVTYTQRYMNDVIEDMSRDEATRTSSATRARASPPDFPKAVRNYDAVTLYFKKAFSNLWLAQASYTWSRLRGNYSGLFRPETGQLSPNMTRDFDLISLPFNRTGPLPGRPHALHQAVRGERVHPQRQDQPQRRHELPRPLRHGRSTTSARTRGAAARRRSSSRAAARPAALGPQLRRTRGLQPEAHGGLRHDRLAGLSSTSSTSSSTRTWTRTSRPPACTRWSTARRSRTWRRAGCRAATARSSRRPTTSPLPPRRSTPTSSGRPRTRRRVPSVSARRLASSLLPGEHLP